MANLKQTSNDLTQIEKKIKALVQAMDELKGKELIADDKELASMIEHSAIQMKMLNGTVDKLKISLSGIGSDGKGLFELNKKINDVNKQLETQIDLMSKLNSVGGLGVSIPTTLSQDNKVKNNQSLADEISKARFEHVKSYVGNQEALSGQSMPLQSQLDYYKQAIKGFEQGSNEYIAVLKMQRQVEQQIEAQAAAARQKALDDEVRQAEASIKAEEDKARRKQEALNKELDNIKKYVSDQNLLRSRDGKAPMSSSEEVSYYDSQLSKFRQNTREYMEVLKLRQNAVKRAEQEEKAAWNNVLGVIKSFSEGVNRAVNKVVSIIRSCIKLITSVFNAVGKVVTTFGRGIKFILGMFGGLSNRVRSTSNEFNFFRNSATELRSKLQLLRGVLNTIFNNEMVNQAKKFISSMLSLNIIVGSELTKSTVEWAQNMENAFGVDAKELIADMGEISGVLKGLGMQAKDVANGAANLTIMSRYLGMMGMAGGDAEQVMSKLTSGMKGMTASIDDLGLSVREAEMDSFLKNLKKQGGEFSGIGTSFANLNEEARVYVRYASLIQQFLKNFGSFDAKGNFLFDVKSFNKSLNSVTGRLGLLRSTWSGFTMTLGAGFAKLGALLAGFLIPVIKTLQSAVEKAFAWLSSVTNINFNVSLKDDTTSLDFDTSGVDKTKDSVSKLNKKLDETSEKAKKAKGNLQGFDRVNNVASSSSTKSSNSKGSDNFDYSSLVGDYDKLLNPLESQYGKFLDKLNKKNKDYISKAKKAIKGLVDYFKEKAKEITGRKNFDLGFDFPAIKDNLKETFDNIKNTLASWGTFVIEIGLKIADDMNIGKIFTKVTELIKKISELARAFSDVAIPVFREFYDEHLKPVFKFIGKKAVEYIDKNINKLQEWIDYWSKTPEEAGAKLKKSLEDLWSVGKGEKEAEGVLQNLVAVFRELKNIGKELASVIKDLVKEFGKFLAEEFLPWLVEKLGQISDWLAKNKDKIKDLLTMLGGIAWEGFKIFVDLVGKLIDFAVNHPTAVVVFFSTLIALKIGSWALTTAASIGRLVQGLTAFGAMFRSGGILSGVSSKLGGLMSSVKSSVAAASASVSSKVVGGLSAAGTALGSGAATTGGAAVAGGAGILGITGGVLGLGSGIKDLVDSTKEDTEEGKRDKQWSGGTKIGLVGAGAATGAAVGSVVPVVGTALGAAVGAGVGGITALFKGEDIGTWIQGAWDNNIKPFFTETIPGVFNGMWEKISTFFGETAPNTTETVGSGVSEFFGEKVPHFFGDMWDNVKTFFGEKVPNAVEKVGSGVNTFFGEKVPHFFGDMWDNVKTFFGEKVPNAVEKVGSGVNTFFGEKVPKFFGGMFDNVKTFFGEKVPNAVKTVGSGVNTFFGEKVPNFFGGMWDKVGTFFGKTVPNATKSIGSGINAFLGEKVPSFFDGLWDKVGTFFGKTVPNAVKGIGGKIKGFFEGVGDAFDNLKTSVKATISKKSSATTSKKVTTNAVGGSIAGGQLFIANEGGNAELIGNIDGTGKTNVANNNMIVSAMKSGVFEAVYNAMAEIQSQTGVAAGNTGNIGGANIKIEGFGLIDQSTLRELARLLSPYINSNNINIADSGFSI